LYGSPTGKNKVGVGLQCRNPSGLRGRLEVGTDVSPRAEMVDARSGIEVPPTSPNQFPPTSMPKTTPQTSQTTRTQRL